MLHILHRDHRNAAPEVTHIIRMIDRELSILGIRPTTTDDRLRTAQWVLTCLKAGEALLAFEQSGFNEEDGPSSS